MTPPPLPGLLIAPERTSVREAAVHAAELAGMRIVEAPSEARVALIDLTHPEGAACLDRLRALPALQTLAVHDGKSVPEALLAGANDLLRKDLLEADLPLRLKLALVRGAKELEGRERHRELQILLELTAKFAGSLDVEVLLHDVTRRLADQLAITRASLVVIDEQGDAGYVVAASDDPTLKNLQIELSRYPEIREVFRTGKPVILEDAPLHPLLEGVSAELTARDINAIAAVPLAVHGKVLGALLVRGSSSRHGFSAREIDFLATVAHATAVALRNATLLESVRGQTEREKSARIAAEERAAELARYESFFAHMSEGVAILDADATVLLLNPTGGRILEVCGTGARGQHIHQLTSPTDENVLLQLLAEANQGFPQQEIDVAARTPGGRRLTLSFSAAPLPGRREGAGGPAVILSFRDVTLQRELELELRQTKDFLERLIDSSVDAVIAADMKGRVILFNKGAEAITGFSRSEALGSLNVRTLYPEGVAHALMARLRSEAEGGAGRLNVSREEILTKAGERVPVNMTASIIFEGNRELATVGIFSDLRERERLERKLSDAEVRLEESEKNAMLIALAGTAAHELNQPLTSIMGYAELLKRRLREEDGAWKPVDIIYREAERMAEIVRKIGKITRFETKAYIGSAKIVDLDKASSNEE